MNPRLWVTLGLVLTMSAVAATDDWRGLDSALGQRVGEGEPGFSVLVLDDGETVFAGNYGLADLETKRPVTPETPFYIASLGKPITALAIMQLAEDGKLALDQPVSAFVEGLPEWLQGVRIEHALTHTAGVPDYPDDLAADDDCLDNQAVVDWLGRQAGEPPVGGRATAYSNAAYVLLAEVVERVTGTSYRHYVHQNIFGPAGMVTAAVIESPDQRPGRRATGYSEVDGEWRLDDYRQCTTGPGGIYASASDLAALDRALRSDRLLSPSSKARMYTPATLDDGSPTPFSPGWISGEIRGGDLVGLEVRQAFGDLAGFRAAIRRFVAPPVTIIWLSNRGQALFDAGIETAAIEAGLLPANEKRD